MSMTFDGRFTGCDTRFEPKRLPVRPLSRVGLSHVVLPYREAQEVKSYVAFVGIEGVCCSCFRWVQRQSHTF